LAIWVCLAKIYKPERESLYEVDDFGEGSYIQWKNILPAVVLGIRPLAVVIQLMRNSLLKHSVRIISVLHVPKGYLNFKSFESML
jgi:hypothetical protein